MIPDGKKECYRVEMPYLQAIFVGTGDLFASCLLGWMHKDNNLKVGYLFFFHFTFTQIGYIDYPILISIRKIVQYFKNSCFCYEIPMNKHYSLSNTDYMLQNKLKICVILGFY